jgi:hypothetical protein
VRPRLTSVGKATHNNSISRLFGASRWHLTTPMAQIETALRRISSMTVARATTRVGRVGGGAAAVGRAYPLQSLLFSPERAVKDGKPT